MKLTIKDILAGVVMLWCLGLITAGMDSWIKYTLLVVTAAYFGVDILPVLKQIKSNKDQGEG